jgi:hypothetical protein
MSRNSSCNACSWTAVIRRSATFIVADMSAAPYHVAVGARTASGSYDASADPWHRCDVPLMLINSDYRPTDLAHLRAQAPALSYPADVRRRALRDAGRSR